MPCKHITLMGLLTGAVVAVVGLLSVEAAVAAAMANAPAARRQLGSRGDANRATRPATGRVAVGAAKRLRIDLQRNIASSAHSRTAIHTGVFEPTKTLGLRYANWSFESTHGYAKSSVS
jgi:hypothetical protein